MSTLQQTLQIGISLHRAGQLHQARDAYAQVLRQQPAHSLALQLSGVIASQLGNAALAVQLIRRCIEINPANAAAYCDLGSAFKQLNHHQPALQSYDRAIALDGSSADAHSNRGSLLLQMQRREEALTSIERALELRPDLAPAWLNRGNVLRALERAPEAMQAYDRAIALNPAYAEAHFNKASLLLSHRHWQRALASLEAVIAAQPKSTQALLNRGIALKELGRSQAALESFESAIASDGSCAEAHCNRGSILRELGRYEMSLSSFHQALSHNPLLAEAHCNKGNTLKQLNRFDEALACYERAIELKENYPEAHVSRGVALTEMRHFDAAFESFGIGIAQKPDFAEAHLNRAMLSLMLGQFGTGWVEYEWRRQCANALADPASQRFAQASWRGEASLAGRTIVLWCEQGLGDTLQFCRYAALVANLGATVILEVQAALRNLLATLPNVSSVVSSGDALPPFDFHCPLMSLPLAFNTALDSIPSTGKYLQVDADRIVRWQTTGKSYERPRIGLVWSGNRMHRNDHNRSISLRSLLQALPANMQYISLQVDLHEADRALLARSPEILHCGTQLRDFHDTAALCETLDLLITVDTSVAHLSAALGRETWILLPFATDWRWLLDRTDSPWYGSVRLYRQETIGDWSAPLAQAQADLLKKFPKM